MLRIVVLLAVFPALSLAALVIVCPAPSAETVTSAGQLATPESASEQL
jgi:hypothetical protein